ncbi:MAG: hypothetical protein ACO1QS_04290 [Verrucomicrobiota bacterium]
MARHRLVILSDIHYAGAAEQARGSDYETRAISSPGQRWLVRMWRRHLWLRDPFGHNHQLDRFLTECPIADFVVANGDYSCDSAFIGVSDEAACASAAECLGKLRERFNSQLRTTIGDHEFGKRSLGSGAGGMKLASLHATRETLQLPTSWRMELGRHVIIGMTSSLAAVPSLAGDQSAEEKAGWQEEHQRHLAEVCELFRGINSSQRILLFCHDPTALPFLWEMEEIRSLAPQIERTIIGHLHSNLIFRQAKLMAGLPPIRFLGPTVTRNTQALNRARVWKPFCVQLCPSLAGMQLLRDGGYLSMDLRDDAPMQTRFHGLPW